MTCTILYIEDDASSRQLVKRALAYAGYEVILAERGLQGIDLARSHIPDLVLTDIDLPDMSGYEVATALRSDAEFGKRPIVALTALERTGSRQDIALAAGITGFLTKPVRVEQLLNQIEFYLQGGEDEIDANVLSDAQAEYTRAVVQRLEARIRQLESANEALSRLDRMKESFIQITAHELRTPLTLIFGYSRLLEDYPALKHLINTDEEIRTLLDGLVASINRMHEVVDQILITSRILTNQIDLTLASTNLGAIVQKVLDFYAEALEERQLTVYFDIEQWPRSILVDSEMLRLVIDNLIGNAIKYTPNGGEIVLKAETDDMLVQFMVKDSGIGIDLEQQEHIFEHFHTVDEVEFHSTSKTAFGGGGLGLGLPVCKGIIEAHGGKIWVESLGYDPLGCPGSKFYVALPLKQNYDESMMTK